MSEALLTLLAACAFAAPHRPAAPDLSGARAWLNVAQAPSRESLWGKVVLVYFADDWSAAGRRTTLAVQRLEAALPRGFVAIGVRSPRPRKPAETTDGLRTLVVRREISHPVADDGAGAIAARWQATEPVDLRLLDARGRETARFGNAATYAQLLAAATALVQEAKDAGELDERPLPLALERDKTPASAALSFPTRLAYDSQTKRLVVADSGRNRFVSIQLPGGAASAIGHGAIDFRDGPPDRAGFDHPEGLAFAGNRLFLADTGNDALRLVDARGNVTTFADVEPLRWPRGMAAADGWLYVAAGERHEIWAAKLPSGRPFRYAGTGRAGRRDGPAGEAGFEEPAGLAVLGRTLWVADAEDRSLRAIDLGSATVSTPRLSAALWRPEALAVSAGKLLVADSGDGTLKSVDPASGEVTTLAGGFLQPSGVAVVGDEIVVSDTGRSRLLRLSADGRTLGELAPTGLTPAPRAPPQAFLPPRREVETRPAPVKAGVPQKIELSVELPKGMVLNPRAPFSYRVSETRGAVTFEPATRKGYLLRPRLPAALTFVPAEGRSEALLDVDFYYCRADGTGLCRSASQRFVLRFDAANDAPPAVVKVVAKGE